MSAVKVGDKIRLLKSVSTRLRMGTVGVVTNVGPARDEFAVDYPNYGKHLHAISYQNRSWELVGSEKGDLAKAAKVRLIKSVNHIDKNRWGQIGVFNPYGRKSDPGLGKYYFDFPPVAGFPNPCPMYLREDDEYEILEWLPGEEPCTTSSFTIENVKGVMELFVAQSTEVIDGVVPQVRYGALIVWQGDPVPAQEEDGTKISSDDQNKAAIEAANEKIAEVVRRQFQ